MTKKIDRTVFKGFDQIKADDQLIDSILRGETAVKKKKSSFYLVGAVTAVAIVAISFVVFGSFNGKKQIAEPPIPKDNSTVVQPDPNENKTVVPDPIVEKPVEQAPVVKPSLQKVGVTALKPTEGGSDGFHIYIVKDLSEVITPTPITGKEDQLLTLPVYKNPFFEAFKSEKGTVDFDALKSEAVRIKDTLGLGKMVSENKYNQRKMGFGSAYTMSGKGYSIWITEGATKDFSVSLADNSNGSKNIAKSANKAKWDGFINKLLPNPSVLTGVNYNKFDSETTYTDTLNIQYVGKTSVKGFYYPNNDALSLSDQFTSYSFEHLSLNSVEGKIGFQFTQAPDPATKVGDYPIISKEEAITAFKSEQEKYVKGDKTSRILGMTNSFKNATIAGVELEYVHEGYEEYFMPFYAVYLTTDWSKVEDDQLSNGANVLQKGTTLYVKLWIPAIAPDNLEGYHGTEAPDS